MCEKVKHFKLGTFFILSCTKKEVVCAVCYCVAF